MHVLRVYLKAGQMLELLYRSEGGAEKAARLFDDAADDPNHGPDVILPGERAHFSDDFGKVTTLHLDQVAGWQASDYDAEIDGAIEIANCKQQAQERINQRAAARHGLIGANGPQLMPANGRIIGG